MGCPQRYDRGLQEFKEHPGLVRFWLHNGKIWWNTHDIKSVRKKYNSPYEVFVCNVFFHSYKEFREATDGLFGKVDCKKFLEDYFKIKL